MASLAEKLAEYDKLSESAPSQEAGAGHYLKRGALQGISALADSVPNLYNLAKGLYSVSAIPEVLSQATGKNEADFLPEIGRANPIANFLLEGYGLDKPVVPSSSIGGKFGAAVLEGAGAGVAQGPMGLVKAAPSAMLKELAIQEAKNAALGSLAGGGAEAGNQATGGSPLGALAGGVIGGVVVPSSFLRLGGVTVGGARAGAQTLKDINAQAAINSASGKIEPAFSDYVGETLKGAVAGTPNAAGNITEGLRLQSKIPGFNPSVAEMAGSPGLVDIQKKFALLNPKNLNAEVARTEGNLSAIQDYRRSIMPKAEQPQSIRSAINQSFSDYEKALSEKASGVAGKLPVSNQLEIGGKLSSIAQAEKDAAKPAISAAYEEAYSLAPDSVIDAKSILSKIEETLGVPLSQVKPDTAPNTFKAIQRFFGGDQAKSPEELEYIASRIGGRIENPGSKATMTLQEAADLRRAVGADASLAAKSTDPLSATRLRNISGVKGTIDESIAGSPIAQEAKDAFAAANEKYKTEFAPRFNEGANLRVFKDSSLNEPRIVPDKFVSEYFKSDAQAGVTRANQFSKLFGSNQEAKDAAKEGILDIYRQKVVNPSTGAINPSAHNSFMRDYGRTLESFRSSGVNAAEDIIKIGREAGKVTRAMDELSSLAKTMKFETVNDLANDALKSPKTMGNTIIRIPKERRGTFNTILLDKAFESGTASGMQSFLEKNMKTLSMTIPPEQLSAMKDIAKALSITERAPIHGNIAAGGADMLKNSTGTSTATVFSQIRAVTGGRSSVEWAAINLAMPALNKMTQTSFSNVMESALHSKESAVALRNYLLAESPKEANKWAERILSSMKSSGKLLWSAKGPITSNFIGPQKYPEALGRSGSAIQSQIQDERSTP